MNNDRRYNDGDHGRNNNRNSVYSQIRRRLADLEFRAFQQCVFLWLGAKGYRQIEPLGRHFQRGRRRRGGADFIGFLPGSDLVKVAIQVKHWKTPIQRRAVDELWGFMLREGIPSGMIVANNTFFPRTTTAALEFPGRPIRLVSVSQLAGSLAGLGMTVRPSGFGYVVDESFFRSLRQLRFASSLADVVASLEGPNHERLREARVSAEVSTTPPIQPDSPDLPLILLLSVAGVLVVIWALVRGGWL